MGLLSSRRGVARGLPGPCPTLCVEKSTSPSLPCLPKGRWWNGLIVPVLFLSTILPFLAYSGADVVAWGGIGWDNAAPRDDVEIGRAHV